MKALVYTAPNRVEYTDQPEPRLEAGEVVLRIDAVGICGSDMHAYHGRDPRRVPPLVLGHELSGQIVAGPGRGVRVTVNPHIRVFPRADTGRPYSRNQVGRVFRDSSRAAGLVDFHFHDLRHHGATMALNKGFRAPIVMALGGWKSEAMMRRYAAVTDSTLRAAAEAVAGNEPTVNAPRV